MLSAKKSELQATHFTFGNDEPCLKSTYALDFGSQIPNVIPKPLVRPNPAEVRMGRIQSRVLFGISWYFFKELKNDLFKRNMIVLRSIN